MKATDVAVISFLVRVPVLSEQRTSIHPSISTVARLFGSTFAIFILRAIIKSVNATPTGMPSGMKATTQPITLLSIATTFM
jgi:hypothetical protein